MFQHLLIRIWFQFLIVFCWFAQLIFQIRNLQNPIVLLTHSPKMNLDRLIQTVYPKEIIADGSNYPSFIERWESSASENKIPFHFTGRDGAYILK